MADEFFQSYRAQRAGECVVHSVCWGGSSSSAGSDLGTHSARGGEVFDTVFVGHLTERDSLPNVRDLDLKYVRDVTMLFNKDYARADGERFYLFGEVVLALLELFVACAVRGRSMHDRRL